MTRPKPCPKFAAARATPGRGLNIRELCEQEKLPRKFIEQILSTLRSAGYIEGGNEQTMTITEGGLAALGDFDPLPTGRDLLAYWLRHRALGKCEREVLIALADAPGGLDADALCRATGYEFSGGFRNALSALRTLGLIQGRNVETMRIAEEMMR